MERCRRVSRALIGKTVSWAWGQFAGLFAGKGYESFSAFKKAYGAAGQGMAWHHIVEQNADNIAKFGAEKIHNTKNLIKLRTEKGVFMQIFRDIIHQNRNLLMV